MQERRSVWLPTKETRMTLLHLPTGERPHVQGNLHLDNEADHRIANNLGLIVSLLRVRARAISEQSGTMDRAQVRMLLEDIAARVETVAHLHRILSQSGRTALVDLSAFLRELCTSLTGALSPNAYVHVTHQADDACFMSPDQVLTLGMLSSELITNSVKYAHPTGVPVKMAIGCEQNAGQLVVEFADDGVGLPEGFDPAVDGGLGLRVVRSLTAQLGATIKFDSSPLGTRVRLEMPIAFDGAA
jgi:two-component sensor histidine kinase